MSVSIIKPLINRYYQHRYGGLYRVSDIAISTIDKSKWIVYHHTFPFDYETWIRPYDEWCDGRFRLLEHSEYNQLLSKDRNTFQDEINIARNTAKNMLDRA